MSSNEKFPSRAELFEALFVDGEARSQWLWLIRRQLHESAVDAFHDLDRQVFDRLWFHYVDRAPLIGAPGRMGAYGFLSNRFTWDAGREASKILKAVDHAPLIRDDGTGVDVETPDDKVVDEYEALIAAIRENGPVLGPKERAAFEARLLCDFDAESTYRYLGLAPGQRGAHNAAWMEARKKIARWLEDEWCAA
jgi:hypothetical protein